MAGRGVEIARGVSVERVGNEVVAYLSTSQEIVRVSGDAALVLESINRGEVVIGVPAIVDDLIDLGVLEERGPSRRNLLTAGAVGVGAGIAVLAMPGVAAASSVIAIQGLYYAYDLGGDRYLEVQIPGTLGAPAVDFPEGQGNPTALTIASLPAVPLVVSSPVTQYDSSATIDGGLAYDRATWRIDVSESPALTATFGSFGDAIPTTGDTLTATFTWGAISYVATLTYLPPN